MEEAMDCKSNSSLRTSSCVWLGTLVSRLSVPLVLGLGFGLAESQSIDLPLVWGSKRKVQAPEGLSPDNFFTSDIGLSFWKGSAVVPTGSVLLITLGIVLSRLWGKQNSITIFNRTIPITISSLV